MLINTVLRSFFCFTALLFITDWKPNPVPALRHKFTVIAHRGDHQFYPENTLAAYKQAILNDADYIEIDLRTTSDGQLVSLHDNSVERTTNGRGLVKDLSLKQVLGLKINNNTKCDTTTYRVPTFQQILKLCKGRICIYIDFKEASAAATFKMLKQNNMDRQAIVYINKPEQYYEWRNVCPTMPLMLSMPDSVKSKEQIKKFINAYKPDVLDGNYTAYNEGMLAVACGLSIPVWPDGQSTSEGKETWDKAVALKLTGLQTDHVFQLVNYLKQKGLR